MRTVTLGVHVGGVPYKATACVYQEDMPAVYIHSQVYNEWADTTWEHMDAVDEDIEDLHDAAFLEALQQEEEDNYEAIEASQTGF